MRLTWGSVQPVVRMRRLPWFTLLVALVVGGMVHIVATLAIPKIATGTAWHRLSADLPVNSMVVLPPSTPQKQLLPFLGPDVRIAVCRYDVSQSSVTVNVALPEKGWTLALYSSAGDNFYAVPAQELRRSEVGFVLLPPAQRLFGLFNWGRQPESSASQIIVPDAHGLVVVRAPMRGRIYQSEVEAVLSRAQCAVQR